MRALLPNKCHRTSMRLYRDNVCCAGHNLDGQAHIQIGDRCHKKMNYKNLKRYARNYKSLSKNKLNNCVLNSRL